MSTISDVRWRGRWASPARPTSRSRRRRWSMPKRERRRAPWARCWPSWPGVNSVSGPGMLDFLLAFSLPKLVLDDEVCGQCLHFVRELRVVDDLPATNLVNHLRENDHLITSPHTLKHWPSELYLTDPGLRPRQPRNLDRDGIEGAVSARLRGGEPAARVLHADPDGRGPRQGDAAARHLGPKTADRAARVAAAPRAGRRPIRPRSPQHRQAPARAGCRGRPKVPNVRKKRHFLTMFEVVPEGSAPGIMPPVFWAALRLARCA